MDSKQAVNEIMGLMANWVPTDMYSSSNSEPINIALEIAIEALEKQIPKDPIRYTKLANDRFTYLCPNCNRQYMDKVFLNDYCDSCGQKLNLRLED